VAKKNLQATHSVNSHTECIPSRYLYFITLSCALSILPDPDTPGPLSIQPFLLSASSLGPGSGPYGAETETKVGSPLSPSYRQAGVLSSSGLVRQTVSSEFLPSSIEERGSGRLARSQVQRLQGLIQDFNREINGSPVGENPGLDTARITELHDRIAELTAENMDPSNIGGTGRAGSPSIPPPAYEADPRQLGYLGQVKRR
jgi:hypothetical protein